MLQPCQCMMKLRNNFQIELFRDAAEWRLHLTAFLKGASTQHALQNSAASSTTKVITSCKTQREEHVAAPRWAHSAWLGPKAHTASEPHRVGYALTKLHLQTARLHHQIMAPRKRHVGHTQSIEKKSSSSCRKACHICSTGRHISHSCSSPGTPRWACLGQLTEKRRINHSWGPFKSDVTQREPHISTSERPAASYDGCLLISTPFCML